ncbi:MAG TPA: hypothetical protein VFA10_25285 [Ktedonobacteraceae bacterium]|nr:hypothetical protein [Ktedonobacteraceae bacterium]
MTSQRKTHVVRAAQSGSQFIQLEMREPQLAEEAFVQGVRMHGLPGRARWEWWLVESPATRRASDGSSPSASPVSTMAIWWEGVFRRYRGVLRLEVKVVWQAGPRNVWIRSVWPCLPSPTRAWI